MDMDQDIGSPRGSTSAYIRIPRMHAAHVPRHTPIIHDMTVTRARKGTGNFVKGDVTFKLCLALYLVGYFPGF